MRRVIAGLEVPSKPALSVSISACQPPGCVGGMVGDDDVGAGAFDARQRFEDGTLLV